MTLLTNENESPGGGHTDNVLFVGMKWWGPGPHDFRNFAKRHTCDAVELADLSTRAGGYTIKNQLLNGITLRAQVQRKATYALTVVLAPHRLSAYSLKFLRKRSVKTVAMIGDIPTGEREFTATLPLFDGVFAPNTDWVLGDGTRPSKLAWPHLTPESWHSPRTLSMTRPELVIVGTAYPHRIAVADGLRNDGHEVRVFGRGWPSRFNPQPPMPRLRTLEYLRSGNFFVLNIPHIQMADSLNPFFFDLAASGVPQITIAPQPVLEERGMPTVARCANYYEVSDRLPIAIANNRALQTWCIDTQSVDARIDDMMKAGL